MTTLLIRLVALTAGAVLAVFVPLTEAALAAASTLADAMPGDNPDQRLAALGLACVGAQVLTTLIAVVAIVALGV